MYTNNDIRARRDRLGLTQLEVAELLNLSGATISNIEAGQYSWHRKAYEQLLTKLEEERLAELIQIYPRQAGRYLGELASARVDEEEPPNPGRQAA